MREKMQVQTGMRALVEIGDGVHHRQVDTEEFHENEQAELEVFLKARIQELEGQVELETRAPGSPTTSGGKVERRVRKGGEGEI